MDTPNAPTPSHARRILLPIVTGALVLLTVAGVYGCRTLAKIDYADAPAGAGLEGAEPGGLVAGNQAETEQIAGDQVGSQDRAVAAAERLAAVAYTARESGVLVGPLLTQGRLEAAWFWPDADRVDLFMVQDAGEDAPMSVQRTMTLADDGSLEIVRTPAGAEPGSTEQGSTEQSSTEQAESDSGGASSRTVLVRTDAGGVMVRFNSASKIESTFDPEMLFLPVTLGADESIQSPFTVDAKGPRFGTGIGEGTVTVRGLGTQPVRTPGGDFDAFVFETSSSFQIGPAKIARTRHAWIALPPAGGVEPGPGIVAEESSQTVKVFGISFSSKAWVSVLAGP